MSYCVLYVAIKVIANICSWSYWLEMTKNYYYTLDQAFEMVAADSNSGSEPEYSEYEFSEFVKFYKIFW